MKNDFKAKMYADSGLLMGVVTATYYCSGEDNIKDQDMCVDFTDGTQLVLNTESIIKLLKKHGRI